MDADRHHQGKRSGTSPRGQQETTLAANAASLYLAHFLGLLAPLITVPYLARVLRPEGWGLVVFAQSFGAWLYLFLEYGFDLSGTRAVARVRNDPTGLSRVTAGVQSAKLLLFLCLSPLILMAAFLAPLFRQHPEYLLWAWLFAAARGLFPNWFFFGQERMKAPAFAEAGAKVLAAAGVFVFVRCPEDGWRVLALQAVAMATAVFWLTVQMHREMPLRWSGITLALRTLRHSVGVFIFRSSTGFYVQGSAFLLGLLTTPVAVAFFGGADRIVRAVVALLQPLSQAFFPRISRLMVKDRKEAGRVLRLSLLAIGGLGLTMGTVTFVLAPFLVRVLLGPGYEQAVPILRLLASLPAIIGVGTVFGIQWALPAGFDRPFYLLVLFAGALNLVLAVLLVPSLNAMGMAVSVVSAEFLVAAGLVVVFRINGGKLWPLSPGQVRRAGQGP